jgi:hypothetical protein
MSERDRGYMVFMEFKLILERPLVRNCVQSLIISRDERGRAITRSASR